MADMEFTADFTDLHTLVRLLDKEIPKSAQDSANVFSSAFNKVEKDFRKTAKASQDYYNSLLGVDKGIKQASKSASAFSSIFREMEREERKAMKALMPYVIVTGKQL